MPLSGMIPVVTLFVKGVEAVCRQQSWPCILMQRSWFYSEQFEITRIYMKVVIEICKLMFNYVYARISLSLWVKLVSPFARRQQLSARAAKLTEVKFKFHLVPFFLVYVTISTKMWPFHQFTVLITSGEFHQNPLNVLAERKIHTCHGTRRNTGRKPQRTRQNHNTSGWLQRHKN